MATAGVMTWSKTAASNATADPTVNWAEGQAPSSVNDSARAEMASVAKWRDDISGTLTTAGTSTAYTLTTNATFATAAAMSGAMICFIPHTTSGAAPTLAVDGLTARAINLSTSVAVAAGALLAGTPYIVTYIHASTEFILQGGLGVFGSTAFAGVTLGDGSVGAPALSWTSDTDSGLYRIGANNLGVAVNGAKVLDIATTGLGVTGAFSASTSITGATAAGSMLASQTEMEAASATNKLATPGTVGFHPGVCKAACKFAGADGTALSTLNIASVVRNSTGNYTVTWTTAFSSADYIAVINIVSTNTLFVRIQTQAAGSINIIVRNSADSAASDASAVMLACFGDQA